MLLSGAGDMTTTAWRPRLSASAIPHSGSSAMRLGGNERTLRRDEEVPPWMRHPEKNASHPGGKTKEQNLRLLYLLNYLPQLVTYSVRNFARE